MFGHGLVRLFVVDVELHGSQVISISVVVFISCNRHYFCFIDIIMFII